VLSWRCSVLAFTEKYVHTNILSACKVLWFIEFRQLTSGPGRIKAGSQEGTRQRKLFFRFSLLRFLLQFSIRELFNSSIRRGKHRFMFSGKDELKNEMSSERSREFITERRLLTC
jgi:hypothetical protein